MLKNTHRNGSQGTRKAYCAAIANVNRIESARRMMAGCRSPPASRQVFTSQTAGDFFSFTEVFYEHMGRDTWFRQTFWQRHNADLFAGLCASLHGYRTVRKAGRRKNGAAQSDRSRAGFLLR
nr:MAG TPA: hypothetical protein [Caudoviricetes sp.]